MPSTPSRLWGVSGTRSKFAPLCPGQYDDGASPRGSPSPSGSNSLPDQSGLDSPRGPRRRRQRPRPARRALAREVLSLKHCAMTDRTAEARRRQGFGLFSSGRNARPPPARAKGTKRQPAGSGEERLRRRAAKVAAPHHSVSRLRCAALRRLAARAGPRLARTRTTRAQGMRMQRPLRHAPARDTCNSRGGVRVRARACVQRGSGRFVFVDGPRACVLGMCVRECGNNLPAIIRQPRARPVSVAYTRVFIVGSPGRRGIGRTARHAFRGRPGRNLIRESSTGRRRRVSRAVPAVS